MAGSELENREFHAIKKCLFDSSSLESSLQWKYMFIIKKTGTFLLHPQASLISISLFTLIHWLCRLSLISQRDEEIKIFCLTSLLFAYLTKLNSIVSRSCESTITMCKTWMRRWTRQSSNSSRKRRYWKNCMSSKHSVWWRRQKREFNFYYFYASWPH